MQLYFGGQDVSRQVLVHSQWEFPDFCSLSLGVPWFLFIATGSSLILFIATGSSRGLVFVGSRKIILFIKANLVKLAPKLLKLYLSDFRSVLGAALQQKVALIFWLQFSLCSWRSKRTSELQMSWGEKISMYLILNITLIDNTIKLNQLWLIRLSPTVTHSFGCSFSSFGWKSFR